MTTHSNVPTYSPRTVVQQFIAAFEQRDRATLVALLADQAALIQPISFSGSETPDFRWDGKQAVLAYLDNALNLFSKITFATPNYYAVDDGKTVFVTATGDITTAQGAPYKNIYLWRYEVVNGRITHIDEYANPVTFSQAFGAKLGK